MQTMRQNHDCVALCCSLDMVEDAEQADTRTSEQRHENKMYAVWQTPPLIYGVAEGIWYMYYCVAVAIR